MSPSYAWEIQTDEGGWGLAPTLRNDPHKISGIVNGMDFNEWSPEHDTFLQSDGFQNYNTDLQVRKGLGFRALVLGFGFRVQGSGFRV